MAGTLFCLGLGYTARALGLALHDAGWTVRGTSRDAATVARLAAAGLKAERWDSATADSLPDLGGVTHLLVSAPPDAAGDPVIRLWPGEPLPALRWIGYLSSTAVYGDHKGGWVDETTRVNPGLERGRWRVAAEQAWQRCERPGQPVQIFRLAGIYGPGRNALVSLRTGRARRLVKPGQIFSRIHRDDILQVLRAAIDAPRPGAVYNVCDDRPAPPQDVIAFAAGLLGRPPPPAIPFADADPGPMVRSFYAESKKVRNDRIKQWLGVRLHYPDYQAGLRALLPQDGDRRT